MAPSCIEANVQSEQVASVYVVKDRSHMRVRKFGHKPTSLFQARPQSGPIKSAQDPRESNSISRRSERDTDKPYQRYGLSAEITYCQTKEAPPFPRMACQVGRRTLTDICASAHRRHRYLIMVSNKGCKSTVF